MEISYYTVYITNVDTKETKRFTGLVAVSTTHAMAVVDAVVEHDLPSWKDNYTYDSVLKDEVN